jgi:hypothetical protein
MSQATRLTRLLVKFGFTPMELLIVMLIASVAATITVKNVSDMSVFSKDNYDKRIALHEAILENEPPGEGGWSDSGANNINTRIAVVWIADRLSKMTGRSVNFVYRAIDLAAVFVALLTVHALLKHWYSPAEAVLGLSLFCLLLPLTALNHYFHPWDRPMLLFWAAMILALVNERVVIFTVLYTISVIVKFDSILAAGMILFLYAGTDTWWRATRTTLIVAAIGAAALTVLLILYPGGQEPIDMLKQISKNISAATDLGFAYPPFLTHGLLLALGIVGWKSAPITMRRLCVFGLLLLIPHMLFTNFLEVRAQIGTMLCMLPLALHGVLSISKRCRADGIP